MHPSLNQAALSAFAILSPHAVAALLADAQLLQRAARSGATRPLLRGKNLGLLCAADTECNGDAALFRRAATELGAQVAHIRPSLSERSALPDIEAAARMLGRLYDAIECQSMPTPLVQRLRQHVDVPVFDGLASPSHPIAQVAELLDAEGAPNDKRRFVLQAVLLCAIARG
jgi:ornithine carbamoyltransferase